MKKRFGRSINLATALLLAACSTAPDLSAPAPAVTGSGLFFADDGSSISARYYSNGTVTLQFQDMTRQTLHAARSASGARYALGGQEWWEHHGEATYAVNGKVVFVGKLKP